MIRTPLIAIAALTSACIDPVGQMDASNAERDAHAALAQGDERLIGVYGFSAEAPGATPADEERHGVRFIENTSDTPSGPAEVAQNARAREYAKRYNEAILEPRD